MIKIGFIYKITNKINGKSYIGKTLQTPEVRFKEHCRESRKERCANRPLYRAFNKYGIDNFLLTTIEKVDNNEELSKKEIYWIEYYNTYKNGYNATKGGDGKSYIDEKQVIKLYDQYKNCNKVAELLKMDSGYVRDILKRNNIHILSSKDIIKQTFGKSVLMYSLKMTLIKEFSQVSEAANYLLDNNLAHNNPKNIKYHNSGVRAHIVDVCNNKRKTAYGFIWKWKE